MPKSSKRKFTAILADDHQIVRSGLRAALEAPGIVEDEGLIVVAEACNGLEAIEMVKKHRPNVLFLDVTMPLVSGAEIFPDIRRWSPETRIVVMTAVTSPGLLQGFIDGGVAGLFSKGSDNAVLFERLPMILRGGVFIEDRISESIAANPPLIELTPRERQSLNMILTGRSNKEIADLMSISPKTAEKHRGSLMRKMNVNSITELMSKALREGLVEDQKLM